MRILLAALPVALLAISACSASDGDNAPAPDAPEAARPAPATATTAAATPDANRADALPLPGPEDKDPQALLSYWKQAVEARDYVAANAAWRSGVKPALIPQGPSPAVVTFGEGQQEGAAGSLYFTVPVTVMVDDANGKRIPIRGTLTARRANDVDGASAGQLSWRIVSLDWN